VKSMAVIAIGSRIMKDDGIAVRVAEAIKDALGKENVDVVIAETDCEYGFDAAGVYDHIVVLDAALGGSTPGQVTVLPLSDAQAQKIVSQHDISLIDMAAREESLSGALIVIEAAEVGFGFELSKTLQDRFKSICGKVRAEILSIRESLKDS
jgi:hydrogenase maturation protease